MDDYTIDTLIDDTYGKPNYVAKKPRPIQVSFRLDSTNNDDIAIERILSDWADKREKNKNIKAAIGLYHAIADRNDIQFLEDSYPNIIAEIQLAGRREMQEQIDELKRQNELLAATITMLTRRLDAQESALHDNVLLSTGNASKIAQTDGRVQSVGKWITSVQPLIVAVGKKHKLTDGSK